MLGCIPDGLLYIPGGLVDMPERIKYKLCMMMSQYQDSTDRLLKAFPFSECCYMSQLANTVTK